MGLFERIFGQKDKQKQAQAGVVYQGITAYQPHFYASSGSIYEQMLIRESIHALAVHSSKLRITFNGRGAMQLEKRLGLQPNALQTWDQMLYRTRTILETENTCILAPAFDKYGRVSEIYPILPSSCVLTGDTAEPMVAMRFPSGGFVQLPTWQVGVLTKFQYRDDFFGSTNAALRKTIDLLGYQDQGIEQALRNAASYRFMACSKNFASPDDLKKQRKEFDKNNMSGEGGGILLFPNTFGDPKQIQNDHYTIDAETMKIIKDNIHGYFGTNDDVTHNKAYGDAWSAFYEGGVEPFAIQLSNVLTILLSMVGELTGGAFVMATANRLQYMSNSDRLKVTAQLIDRGVMCVDDGREIWNLPPLPDGKGQVYRIRGEYKDAADENGAHEED